MKCLPLNSKKVSYKDRLTVGVQWINKNTNIGSSFNDQPTYRTIDGNYLEWSIDGLLERGPNKPAIINYSSRSLMFYTRKDVIDTFSLKIKDIHSDYRDLYKEWNKRK